MASSAVDAVASALSSLNVEVRGPELSKEARSDACHNDDRETGEWILIVDEEDEDRGSCFVWRPGSSQASALADLPEMFAQGSVFVPLASSGGLIFGRDSASKRFLIGNPVTGVWKCIPMAVTDEDEDENAEGDDEQDEDEMCHEYDFEGKIFEYKMLYDQSSSSYWIIGVAGHGEWSSWEEINLLYEYHSKRGVWREIDMLNHGEGFDCSVSQDKGTPDNLHDYVVLSSSGLYNPKRHLVQESSDPEDPVYELWGGAVIAGGDNNRKLIVASTMENPELVLWSQATNRCSELSRLKPEEEAGGSSSVWPHYGGGARFVTVANCKQEEEFRLLAYDLARNSWHQLRHPGGWPLILHFTPSSTAAP